MTTNTNFPLNQTVSFTGQENIAGDKRALFQELFAGEVLTAFKKKNIMMDKHRVKTIKNGRSYSFPMVGTTGAKYHIPGQEIEADPMAHAKRTATIDELLISPVFLDNLDEAMNHYDVRSIYTTECAKALSNTADKNIIRMACKAAAITNEEQCIAAGITPVKGETFTNNIALKAKGDETKASKVFAALMQAAEEWDTKDVDEEAVCILPPSTYYALFNDTDISKLIHIHRDVGGEGSVAKGTVAELAGFKLFKSNNMPNANETTGLVGTPESRVRPEAYRGDFSKVIGLIMSPSAICTVKLMDLQTESEYQLSRQGWLFVAKYAMGHNILRPACAMTINKAG
ncbi:capsid protein [Endozoicomonas sp. SM1973]|uniref:Capsid protein n=1 Tax=Spartinivicinus marinus TaxID=2994442 RepID=A0A853IIJ2_9GAMM|nr:capsid protein [Spartinivicinus marinus]MCX4025635.1 hypothetical protein [Spartinivicinus marinus]NYZ69891.1 capsid protein [Spartinivicinus marinus]